MGEEAALPGEMVARRNVDQRWWALAACCATGCAKLIEPPIWIFRPPEVSAFGEQWVGYNIAISVVALISLAFLLSGGTLGDVFGRQRVLLIGLAGSIVANVLLLYSRSILWFIVTRFVGGAFGALVIPLSLAMIYVVFDDIPSRARAIAIYVFLTTIASLAAALLGQLMYRLFDWRAAFVAPTMLGALAFALALRQLPESRVPQAQRFDAVGHAAWTLTLLAIVGGVFGWRVAGSFANLIVLLSLVLGAIGLALLIWWDYRTPNSLLGQSSIRRRALSILIVYGVSLQFGLIAFVTQFRNALIGVRGYGTIAATLALAPFVLGMLAMLVYGQRHLAGVKLRALLSGSLAVIGGICAATAISLPISSYFWLAVLLAFFGAASIVANTAWNGVFLLHIPNDLAGVRTGISTSITQIGSAVGIALTSDMLLQVGRADYAGRLLAAGVPARWIGAALDALNAILNPASPDAAAIDPIIAARLLAGYQLSYALAEERVLLVVAGICLCGSLVAWFGLGRQKRAVE
jgi:MFS family permease